MPLNKAIVPEGSSWGRISTASKDSFWGPNTVVSERSLEDFLVLIVD